MVPRANGKSGAASAVNDGRTFDLNHKSLQAGEVLCPWTAKPQAPDPRASDLEASPT
jgi:hypothetical protein